MQNVHLTGSADIREVDVREDWAWIRNYIEITIASPERGAMRRSGYALSILRKQADGKWLLWRDANLVA